MDQSSLMPIAPDRITENVDFSAQELLEAPAADRSAMLEGIAKALTRRLLKDNPGIGDGEAQNKHNAGPSSVSPTPTAWNPANRRRWLSSVLAACSRQT
jgi:hypothetical protein